MAKSISFIVSGEEQPAARARGTAGAAQATPARGRLKQSVRVGALRGAAADVRVTAQPGRDMVVLQIAGGPTLYLRPETAYDLVKAQARPAGKRGAPEALEALPEDTIRIPAQLQWRGLEKEPASRGGVRGGLGEVLLERIDVVTDAAADLTADLVVQRVDAQVVEGVYALDPGELPPLKDGGVRPGAIAPAAGGGPVLVLVHGTFSSTSGTFGKLWKEHPGRVQALFDHYGGRVYALDHRTLGASPIANALTLARALPKNARVHLLTHSRGGLVAEALARACARPDLAADLKHFSAKGFEQHRADLQELYARVAKNGIAVERVVRVACPARGTLLASKRLDAYLSVFKWSLELAGVPVAPALVDFISEVATRREDPARIPGLAAQVPDSPFVKWLHSAPDALPGDLRVVAGDLEGDSVVSWLKTLLSDAFYWTDNDLVVQTRSMYGGAPRASGGSFVLDQGGKVSHFNYFSNEITAAAIVEGLVDGEARKYRPIGPESWAGKDSGGVRAARARDARAAADKPAVFVLPGILGSNLKVDGRRLWLGPRILFGLKRLRYAAGATNVEPDGPLELYDDLCEFLAETHEVIEFAFDWRKPLEEEARRLADAVQEALAVREASGQPVRMVAHSMGGLLARAMEIERRDVWTRMMSRTGARLLMLGTPNAGSWAPMQVLSGDDTFGNLLVSVGAPFEDHKARNMMAAFPGFLQLQAGLEDAQLGLARAETWQRLADEDLKTVEQYNFWHTDELQLEVYKWGVPTQEVLDQAVRLRRLLDRQRDERLGADSDRILLVAGQADFTPDGFDASSPQGLVYLNARESGDGRVTLASARLPGVRAWRVDCEHGKLPKEKAAYGGYLDLLQSGTTSRLPAVAEGGARAGVGGAARAPAPPVAHARLRPSRGGSAGRPPASDVELLSPAGREQRQRARDPGTALQVTVVNGNLKFIRHPLLLGHYRSLRLTGTERVMDRLIGNAMSEKLDAGSYPDAPGSCDVFVNRRPNRDYPERLPMPQAVIVAGLGEEGKLRPAQLAMTVKQAVIEWAQRELERSPGAPASFDLAATLLGSGGTNFGPGQAAQLIAQGVREANERLRKVGWPRVGRLYLVELFLERAAEAWRALQVQSASAPGVLDVADAVQPGVGRLQRPLVSGYRGADYDLITAISDPAAGDGQCIAYTLDTRRARTEIRAQKTQGPLLRRLVATASNQWNSDPRIGRTLFRLLVPVAMEPFLGGSTEMLIELDPTTAGIPWELLDPELPDPQKRHRPWAIRSKLIRKLRLEEFRSGVSDAGYEDRVLVIGDPACDRAAFPVLPGARAEAVSVHQRFSAPSALGAQMVQLLCSNDEGVEPDQTEVINTLMAHDWRIVHISGHGMPPEGSDDPGPAECPPRKERNPRGVVLSGGTFLGPREIENMRVVPELVFVNCCYLAARSVGQVLSRQYDRARFAATVAEKLIDIGVRCVIAAGWAVDDAAAETFAGTFYDAVLRGRRFIDAVAEARDAAYAMGGNTWAAYQCYGDPDWVFHRDSPEARGPSTTIGERYAGVASEADLVNALQTIAAEARYADGSESAERDRLRFLADRFSPRWGGIGKVAAAFADTWDALGDRAEAIDWYQRAAAAQDGSAPLKASEQLGNLLVRDAWEAVERVVQEGKPPPARLEAKARAQMRAGIELLERLADMRPSMERWSMLGSASKRLAMLQAVRAEAVGPALARMKACYEAAEDAGRRANLANVFYPTLNLVAADLALARGRARKRPDARRIADLRNVLQACMRDDPEFWAAAGVIELDMYEAVAAGRLDRALASLAAQYEQLHARVRAKTMWASVYDQACFVRWVAIPRTAKRETRAADKLLALLRGYG